MKIRSMSPKFIVILPVTINNICAGRMIIRPLLTSRNILFQGQLNINTRKLNFDHENGIKVIKA